MYHKFNFVLSRSALVAVVVIGLPTIEIKNNLQEKDVDKLWVEVFHKFASNSNEALPVPDKDGTSRG